MNSKQTSNHGKYNIKSSKLLFNLKSKNIDSLHHDNIKKLIKDFETYQKSNKNLPILGKLFEKKIISPPSNPENNVLDNVYCDKNPNDNSINFKKNEISNKETINEDANKKENTTNSINKSLIQDVSQVPLNASLQNGHKYSFKIELNEVENRTESEKILSTMIKNNINKLLNYDHDEFPVTKIDLNSKIPCVCGWSIKNKKNMNNNQMTINLNLQSGMLFHEENVINFFGLFEGSKGNGISTFLKEELHKNILLDENYRTYSLQRVVQAHKIVEEKVINSQLEKLIQTNQSSSSLIIIRFNDEILVSNLGKSRAILISKQGNSVKQITRDHKVSEMYEKNRIIGNGEKIKQNCKNSKLIVDITNSDLTRTIGKLEFKEKFKNKKSVITWIPDIILIKIQKDFDIIILGSSSLFSTLSNKEILIIVYEEAINSMKLGLDIKFCVESIIKVIFQTCLERGVSKNLSCILICFSNFHENYNNNNLNEFQKCLENIQSNIGNQHIDENDCQKIFYLEKNLITKKTNRCLDFFLCRQKQTLKNSSSKFVSLDVEY